MKNMKNMEDLKKQLGLTNEQMYQITALHSKGNSVATISKSTGIDKDKIREFLVARDKKPIERERKKSLQRLPPSQTQWIQKQVFVILFLRPSIP
jgi:hypothetical protein